MIIVNSCVQFTYFHTVIMSKMFMMFTPNMSTSENRIDVIDLIDGKKGGKKWLL